MNTNLNMNPQFDYTKEYGQDTAVCDETMKDEETVTLLRDLIDHTIPRGYQNPDQIIVIYKTEVEGGYKFHWRYMPMSEKNGMDFIKGKISIPGKILYSNQPVKYLDGTIARLRAAKS